VLNKYYLLEEQKKKKQGKSQEEILQILMWQIQNPGKHHKVLMILRVVEEIRMYYKQNMTMELTLVLS
jgi:hypothetical protein